MFYFLFFLTVSFCLVEKLEFHIEKTRLCFRCLVAETERPDTTSCDRSTALPAYCFPDFLFDRSPLLLFLVFVSDLQPLVSRRIFSQVGSLFVFKLSTLVIS